MIDYYYLSEKKDIICISLFPFDIFIVIKTEEERQNILNQITFQNNTKNGDVLVLLKRLKYLNMQYLVKMISFYLTNGSLKSKITYKIKIVLLFIFWKNRLKKEKLI